MQKEILVQLTRIADALELANGVAPKTTESPTPEKVEVEKPEESKVTHEDLKALCLAKSREDIKNKPKLKGLLKNYDAVKATDVKKEDLPVIIERINSGDY